MYIVIHTAESKEKNPYMHKAIFRHSMKIFIVNHY